MKCKVCESERMEERPKGPHLGIYCSDCGKLQQWKKQDTTGKTKEDYKNEYMDNEKATIPQIGKIKFMLVGISKFTASQIIELLESKK